MNSIILENKVTALERMVLQDVVTCYGTEEMSEQSYDDLMAKLLKRITDFYGALEPDRSSVQKLNQYGERAEIFKQQFREAMDEEATSTVRQMVNQLSKETLSGCTRWEAVQLVRTFLQRRMAVLSHLQSALTLQMQNYMLLWDYQDAGFLHYCLLTVGDNCRDCNHLQGQIFSISEARVGENFIPMHLNCNCRAGILDENGNIVYIISAGKTEKNEETANWYDAFLRMPQDAKKLFLEFVRAQNERLERKDIAGFLDWLTMGVVSGTLKGYEDRYQELLNDPTLYNVANYLTSGFADTVKGAVQPEEPLSLQHWFDSLGTVSTAFGAYQAGKSIKNIYKNKSATKSANEVLEEIDELDSFVYNKENTLTNAQKSRLNTLENTIKYNLKDSDFSGTLRDLQGNPVPNPYGGYYDHLTEMKQSYISLNKVKRGLEGSLKNPNLSNVDRQILQNALNTTAYYIQKIEKLFEPFGGIK